MHSMSAGAACLPTTVFPEQSPIPTEGEGRINNDTQVSKLGDRKEKYGKKNKCGWMFGGGLGNVD